MVPEGVAGALIDALLVVPLVLLEPVFEDSDAMKPE